MGGVGRAVRGRRPPGVEPGLARGAVVPRSLVVPDPRPGPGLAGRRTPPGRCGRELHGRVVAPLPDCPAGGLAGRSVTSGAEGRRAGRPAQGHRRGHGRRRHWRARTGDRRGRRRCPPCAALPGHACPRAIVLLGRQRCVLRRQTVRAQRARPVLRCLPGAGPPCRRRGPRREGRGARAARGPDRPVRRERRLGGVQGVRRAGRCSPHGGRRPAVRRGRRLRRVRGVQEADRRSPHGGRDPAVRGGRRLRGVHGVRAADCRPPPGDRHPPVRRGRGVRCVQGVQAPRGRRAAQGGRHRRGRRRHAPSRPARGEHPAKGAVDQRPPPPPRSQLCPVDVAGQPRPPRRGGDRGVRGHGRTASPRPPRDRALPRHRPRARQAWSFSW